MERSKKFIKDIFIYAIGNLGSKLITFLLVPLYTYFISPDDFGYYDIVLTLTFLAMGFITFQLRDGTFRFLLDNEDEYTRKSVVSFSYKLLSQSTLAVLIIGILFSFFYEIRDWGWIIAFVIVLSLYEVEIQIVRGLGQNKQFVFAGILTAFQIGLYSLIFVAWLRMGIGGIFCSNILARLVTMVMVETQTRVFKRYFVLGFKDKGVNRALLKYSLPLLPNAVCWWLLMKVFPWNRACDPCCSHLLYFSSGTGCLPVCPGPFRRHRYALCYLPRTLRVSEPPHIRDNGVPHCSIRYSCGLSCPCHPFPLLHRCDRRSTVSGHCHLSCRHPHQGLPGARTNRIFLRDSPPLPIRFLRCRILPGRQSGHSCPDP